MGDTENVRKEQVIFNERAGAVPKETAIGNNTAESIVPLIKRMLEGEILVAEGNVDGGLMELRAALELEDALKYDEPPAWMIPLRHTIGANLVKAGRFAEAEENYREDLRRLPANGWSLSGLAASLRGQQKEEAAAATAQFQKAWVKADVKITSSCLCRPGV